MFSHIDQYFNKLYTQISQLRFPDFKYPVSGPRIGNFDVDYKSTDQGAFKENEKTTSRSYEFYDIQGTDQEVFLYPYSFGLTINHQYEIDENNKPTSGVTSENFRWKAEIDGKPTAAKDWACYVVGKE